MNRSKFGKGRFVVATMLLSGLGIAPVGAQPQAGVSCYHVANVDMWDVLFIRSRQTHLSPAVGAVAPDHTGVLRATGPCIPHGASSRRQWCPVDYFPLPQVKTSGFVKAYFVRPIACPPSQAQVP
jgi:hypothetical protein